MTTTEHKMTRHNSSFTAKLMAKDNDCFYGFCIFDGAYYTGTEEQLKRFKCIIYVKPE